ncbi:Auxin-induced protein [Macleaya cordata]|uniref:Auxin-induced protein n=1 Tax=Macleaya cordata TaxID=56857 RepID=A0A200Q307_MACCD|nr:Auxin-induced protein [Macleaya cordata]
MKQLIRCLARVGDSSQYSLLRSESRNSTRSTSAHRRSDFLRTTRSNRRSNAVPQGYVPVYVGEEMERFVVNAELLNHPIFTELLKRSAQEYGYEQKGVLRIPCRVLVFERVLELMRIEGGGGGADLNIDFEGLLHQFSEDYHL